MKGGECVVLRSLFKLVKDLLTKSVAVFRFEPRICYIWTRKMSLKKCLSQITISDLFDFCFAKIVTQKYDWINSYIYPRHCNFSANLIRDKFMRRQRLGMSSTSRTG